MVQGSEGANEKEDSQEDFSLNLCLATASTGAAMKSFERFLSLLATIPDPRRAEGKLYKLPHVLLFSILAVVTGANSYRGIRTFIAVHRGV
jgi:DDE_Tnp_1-associated